MLKRRICIRSSQYAERRERFAWNPCQVFGGRCCRSRLVLHGLNKTPNTVQYVPQKFNPCHPGSAEKTINQKCGLLKSKATLGKFEDRSPLARISLISTLASALHRKHLIYLFPIIVLAFEIGQPAGPCHNDAGEGW